MFPEPQTETLAAEMAFGALSRHAVILVFVGFLAAAAIIDLRRFIIPDAIVVALLGLWPLWVVLNGHNPIGFTLLGAAVTFAFGVILFAFGLMGGGDVKLMTVVALWAEPAGLPGFLLYTSIAGGMLSIYWLKPVRSYIAPIIGWTEGLRDNKQIPYGVAIAVGGLTVARRLWAG